MLLLPPSLPPLVGVVTAAFVAAVWLVLCHLLRLYCAVLFVAINEREKETADSKGLVGNLEYASVYHRAGNVELHTRLEVIKVHSVDTVREQFTIDYQLEVNWEDDGFCQAMASKEWKDAAAENGWQRQMMATCWRESRRKSHILSKLLMPFSIAVIKSTRVAAHCTLLPSR